MRRILLALAFAVGLSPAFAADNYQATQGSGTTFAAKDNGGAILFPRFIGCDNTTTTQCWSIDASGRQLITITSGSIASGAFASGSIASGAFASGSIGSGAVASGAVASGAYAAGSIASGAMVDLGSQADAACGTDNGACSAIALIKRGNQTATTTATAVQAAIPAGTASIGQVGADPSSGKATPTFAFLALPATTTTQIVALSGSTKTYVTSIMIWAPGTVNVTLKYGTGSNCGTGTTTLAGPYSMTAQSGFSMGSGTGPVLIVPSGQALCVTTDATVTNGGVQLTHQQI